ncbi:MAG TPA: 3'(2'),5'-bisphosphate nucleotidase [Acidiferrobacteraceae bacterium]|nr:3'(2'),5'-bisphosphate nucleotidase [Acidiferrobacteraceae bacterium]
MPVQYSRYLSQTRELAAQAADRILDIYQRGFEVDTKSDGSPLTDADRAAHKVIIAGLAKLSPDIPILSEESDNHVLDVRLKWKKFWLVDPLDGTREFIKRNDEFTVNIALIDNHRPVLGVVHIPVSGVSYFACDGDGAFRCDPGGDSQAIHVRMYRGGAATIATSRSHPGNDLADYLARFEQRQGSFQTLAMGSSIKLCLVAEGRVDIYPRLGPTSEWDTAAAQCVLEAAGGRVVDSKNSPLSYNKPSILNPWFFASGGGQHDWTAYLAETGQ